MNSNVHDPLTVFYLFKVSYLLLVDSVMVSRAMGREHVWKDARLLIWERWLYLGAISVIEFEVVIILLSP